MNEEQRLTLKEWDAISEAVVEPHADAGPALVRRPWYATGLLAVVARRAPTGCDEVYVRDLSGDEPADRALLTASALAGKAGKHGEVILKSGARYFLALFSGSGRALARELLRADFLTGPDSECRDYPFCFPDCRNLTRCRIDNCRSLVCRVVGTRDWPETAIVCTRCHQEPWRRGKADRPVMFDLLEG